MENTKCLLRLNIRYLYKKHHLNLKKLEQEIGFSINYLSINKVIKLCQYFQIDIDHLVFIDLQIEDQPL